MTENTWTVATITEGESWGCRFRTLQMLDDEGNLIDTSRIQPGEKITGTPKLYESWGLIETRDVDKQLIEVRDQESGRKFVVHWDDAWDIDRAEYAD